MFYTADGEWVPAGDLEVGDEILSIRDEATVSGTVDSLEIVETTQTMYDLSVDTVFNFAVGDGQWVVHNCDPRRVLVLGEEANAPYARWLANKHPDWEVWGTKFGLDEQILIDSINNLRVIDNVDGTRLQHGALTSSQQFNDIVFNAPRADASPRPPGPHRDLVVGVLSSSENVLASGGAVRMSSTTGMPAGFFLQGLATGNAKSTSLLPSNYTFVGGKGAPTKGRSSFPFLGNRDFGWPNYDPLENGGASLGISLDDVYWYVFRFNG